MPSILQILRTEHDTEHVLEKQFTEPKIFHGGKDFDLSKRWYVYYSYRNPHTGKLERQPNVYDRVNEQFHTVRERMKHLKSIQSAMLDLLKKGHSPYLHPESVQRYTIESSLNWALDLRSKTLTDTTAGDYKSKLSLFLAYLKSKGMEKTPVQDFKRKDAMEYLNGLLAKNAAKTRNNHRAVLSSLFALLHENDMVTENVIEGTSVERTKSVRHKTFTQEQMRDILELIEKTDSELFLFIRIVAYNFLRPVEVVRLRVQDLKLNETPPYLEVRAKNKLEKIKIIPSILVPELKERGGEGFLFVTNQKGIESKETNRRNYFGKKFLKIKNELKLGPEFTIYSFRHTLITQLYRELRKTMSKLETEDYLMKITGHSTLRALQMYLRDIDVDLPDDYSHLL